MAHSADSLKDFRWDYRLILLRGSDALEADLRTLRDAKAAIDEREILWFALDQNAAVVSASNYPEPISEPLTASIKNRLSEDANQRIFLIGKDGGVKARARTLDLPALFNLIDSMPMRQAEMRR